MHSLNVADTHKSSNGFVIGIGASAGGLAAINEFFDNMPENSNLSFVIVQHLSPDYKSLMGELLSKHTPMQVFEAAEGMELLPNCIYLIPSRKLLTIEENKLKLVEKIKDSHPNSAIDTFFTSLAIAKKDKAVGIILSGTGTDGTRGLEEIKAQGGIVIVQDPMTAEFDGMPNSAINTGCADLILSPEMMGDELVEYLNETPLIRSFNTTNQKEEAIILGILELIHKITGHDFSSYKRPTLNRRLAKRMAELNIRSLMDYESYLNNNPDETKRLSREFLINVTRFFRDEEAFEIFNLQVLPQLFANKKPGDTLKAWVVACSSGEEAYSLAMLFDEYMEKNNKHDIHIKIFATDVDQDAIESASKGVYNEDAVKVISTDRLRKYFIREGNSYKVVPSLRKMIVVAKHDIVKDPPFSQIDILTCRNMLIYMDPLLQKNVFQKFHFALNENGYLFIGPSENIGDLKVVVDEVDKKWKIYKVISKTKVSDHDTFVHPNERGTYIQPSISIKSKNALNNLPAIFSDIILEDQSYAGIYVNKELDIKQAIGNFKNFIDLPDDKFNFNLLKLVPTDLSIALNSCIRKAIKENKRVVHKKVKVTSNKNVRFIDIIIKPYLQQKDYLQPFIFIILNEVQEQVIRKEVKVTDEEFTSERIKELEAELSFTRENLQALVEEVETANEELQSSNEEIVSANEELQSTNEELQSLNEELHTVNAEHQLKIKELIELNEDLNNYFNNTEIGQILLDRKLNIRKFTPVVTKQVNLIETDIGRSIADISTNFKDLDFINEIKNVLKTGIIAEKEITMSDDNIFIMRIAPFLRQNKQIDGIVVNFINITEIKKLNSILEAVFNSSASGILAKRAIRDENHKIVDFEYVAINMAAEKMLNVKMESIIGKRMSEQFPQMIAHLDEYINVVENEKIAQFEYYNEDFNKWFDVVGVKMMDGLVTTFTDITNKKQFADQLKKGYNDLEETSQQLKVTNEELEKSNLDLLQFASVASHDLKEPLRKIQAFGNLFKEKVKDKLEENEIHYLDKVINSSKRMQVLVDDILSLSKLSITDIPRETVDLNKIVNRIVDDLEITISEKTAEVNIGELPVIQAVPGQMHQLFQNLISNSLKFNKGGTQKISIYNQTIDKEVGQQYGINGNYVCISVEDNGIGFEQQYTDKIFGIFQRLNGNNFQGTGIGLAICKKIVDNHGGYIHVESEPGKGAKFSILLPKHIQINQAQKN